LKLTFDELLSNFAFNFNLRRYTMDIEYPPVAKKLFSMCTPEVLARLDAMPERTQAIIVGPVSYCYCSPHHRIPLIPRVEG
jgi:hypothetical protein